MSIRHFILWCPRITSNLSFTENSSSFRNNETSKQHFTFHVQLIFSFYQILIKYDRFPLKRVRKRATLTSIKRQDRVELNQFRAQLSRISYFGLTFTFLLTFLSNIWLRQSYKANTVPKTSNLNNMSWQCQGHFWVVIHFSKIAPELWIFADPKTLFSKLFNKYIYKNVLKTLSSVA